MTTVFKVSGPSEYRLSQITRSIPSKIRCITDPVLQTQLL